MRSALIGYTGFVGGNLNNQHQFTDLYNSKNFKKMEGESYDLVVCAGVSAVKWMANKEPEKDRASIKVIEQLLNRIKAKHFILISTIDVYPSDKEMDEDFDCTSVKTHAYGTHRQQFEQFCRNRFANCTIVRLPGLFGDGLKKNIIYDLLNDNCLEMINPDSSFQYYDLKNLWQDINIAIKNNIQLVNLFTEPVPSQSIISQFFPSKIVGSNAAGEGHYDLHTKYAPLWGKKGDYLYNKNEVLQQMSDFIKEYKV